MIGALDPGKLGCGLALLDDRHSLLFASYVRGRAWDVASFHECKVIPTLEKSGSRFFIERPQVYSRDKSKGDPADLVEVALAAGAWAHAAAQLGFMVELVAPAAWKGQLPKSVCHERARAVLAPAELARVPTIAKTRGGTDMWDAITLALVSAGRLRMR